MDHSNGGEEVSVPAPPPPSVAVAVAPAPVAPVAPAPAPAASAPAPASVAAASATAEASKKNRIQVSNTKKPLFFYVNLAKRFMQQYEEVELSALGMAIATVVTVVEILKNNGLAIEKKISTSTVDIVEEVRNRPVQKAKMEIVLQKSEKFDELMAAAAEENGMAEEHYE